MSTSLAQAMQAFVPALPLAVAYSGGADSTALLLACAEKWPGQVQAFHVNHGLQAAAGHFQQHCEAFCASVGVPLRTQAVNAHAAPGQSPEDAARTARYEAFRVLAPTQQAPNATKNIACIALAQHADDQTETLLLALSRGAGLAGLAAMPAQWQRDGLTYHRPLLQVPGEQLRAWLVDRGVGWVEDPSNADTRFTRNRIRAELMPALEAVFPQFRATFARSAAHAAQAQALLGELAQHDIASVGCPPGLKPLQALSGARQANVLRHWLKTRHNTTPSTAQLDALLRQVAACTTRGHRIHLKVGGGFVQRLGDGLTWYNAAPPRGA